MNRGEILDEAKRLITIDRNHTYGEPEDNFGRIAILLGVLFGVEVSKSEGALSQLLVKVARLIQTPDHLDGYIDLCGYAALAGELATNDTVEVTGDFTQFDPQARTENERIALAIESGIFYNHPKGEFADTCGLNDCPDCARVEAANLVRKMAS